jgi:hypothetical protein
LPPGLTLLHDDIHRFEPYMPSQAMPSHALAAPGSSFQHFRFRMPETGSICDGDKVCGAANRAPPMFVSVGQKDSHATSNDFCNKIGQ